MNIRNGLQMEPLFILHVVNTFTCLLKIVEDSLLQASTVSLILSTLLQGIFESPSDFIVADHQSMKSVFHKLLRL